MNVNRSGYYKWKNRRNIPNRYERNRNELTNLILEEHKLHPSHGYHRLCIDILKSTGWKVSHNLVHKCCKAAGIKSKAKHYNYKKKGTESHIYPNLIKGNWNASGPLQVVVSDMTRIKTKYYTWEWTLVVDTFNNEILTHSVTPCVNSNKTYYDCLEGLMNIVGKKEEQNNPVILHTDQGSVYSSYGFQQTHKDYNIIRSMSRSGTPTDNPIIESLNGWIKDELYLDFDIYHSSDVPGLLQKYVEYFNNERPAAALNYKTPLQYKTEMGF